MKKPLIDEQGRLFGRLSVIDLGILLLVLLAIAGAYVKFIVLEQTAVTVNVAPVRYTLELSGVRDWTLRNIREGDTLFVTGTPVGTVVGLTPVPLEVPIVGDGALWWGEVPARYVLLIDVAGTATVTDGRFLVSRTVPMAVGNSGTQFMTRYAEFQATVREIALYEE